MSAHPCPFMNRCSLATEDCTEELAAGSCDVIHKTTPPPPKEWDPLEPVAVTMTREEWQSVIAWLSYGADWNHARMTWWRDCCYDRRMGAETAAKYEAEMRKAESLCKIIETATTAETE